MSFPSCPVINLIKHSVLQWFFFQQNKLSEECWFFLLSHDSEILLNGWEFVHILKLEFKRIILIIQHFVSIFLHNLSFNPLIQERSINIFLLNFLFLHKLEFEHLQFLQGIYFMCVSLSLCDACCSLRWKSNNNLCQGNNKTETNDSKFLPTERKINKM